MNHPFVKSLENLEFKITELKEIIENSNKCVLSKEIINNDEFLRLFDITSKTALNWREQGVVSYFQINSKIYYRVEDVQTLIDVHYNPVKKKH